MTKPLPHQEEKYGLPAILVATIFAFILLFLITTVSTWHINTPWEATSKQAKTFTLIIKDEFKARKGRHLEKYITNLKNNEFEDDFLLHLLLPLFLSIIISFILTIVLYKNRLTERLKHIDGPKLYYFKEAIKHANKLLKKEIKQSGSGITIHPEIQLPKRRENGNILVTGVHGSGKSVFLINILIQIIIRGEFVFIYDEKKEYTEILYNENCILLAPWDERSYQWNIQSDAFNDAMAILIADMLIPNDSKDAIWTEGSRLIFVSIITILNATKKRWGWSDIARLLTLNEQTFCNLLEKYDPKVARFIEEKSKTTTSFYIKLISKLGWVFQLAKAWPEPDRKSFSVYELVKKPKSKRKRLIVQADKRFKGLGSNFANAIISLMTAHILSLPNTKKREYWLFIDELGNLPKNESLLEWMSLGRSKGCRIAAGTQSISQPQEIYGEKGADSLLNLFTMFAAMRTGAAGGTAEYTSGIFGKRIVERTIYDPKSDTYSWHQEQQQIIKPENLVHLPVADKCGVEGYLLLPSLHSVYRLKWPFQNWKKISKGHIPAKWITKKPSIEAKKELTEGSKSTPNKNLSRRDQLIERRKQNAIDKLNQ